MFGLSVSSAKTTAVFRCALILSGIGICMILSCGDISCLGVLVLREIYSRVCQVYSYQCNQCT